MERTLFMMFQQQEQQEEPKVVWQEANGDHVLYSNGLVNKWGSALSQSAAEEFIAHRKLGFLLPESSLLPSTSMVDATVIDADDAEWLRLHALFTSVREKHHWSIKQALSLLNLPATPYTMQFISRSGSRSFPSKSRDTIGYQIRNSLKSYFESDQCTQLPMAEVEPAENLLYQWCLDNNQWLNENHVEGITQLLDGTLQIRILEEPRCTANEFRDQLFSQKFPPLPISVLEKNAVLVKCYMLALESPIGIKKALHGTAFLLNLKGFVCAITSRHVVVNPGETFLLRTCPVTNKHLLLLENDPNPELFGNACVNPLCDVALIIPKNRNLPLTLNTIRRIEMPLSYVPTANYLTEHLVGKKVLKHGISTGLTMGTIVSVNVDQIVVRGDQVCRFAWFGDSGAAVTDQATGQLLGIVKCGFEENHVVVLPIWSFQDWLSQNVPENLTCY